MGGNQAFGGMDMGALSQMPLTLELAQKIISGIQTAMYQDKTINSVQPFHAPLRGLRENGQYTVTEVQYGNTYMNSFLDIVYPNEDMGVKRPTVFFTHGGGYFGGGKSAGDPLAVGNPDSYVLTEIVAHGYNLVNVDYCLTPEGRFPIPLIQLCQAVDFCREHAGEYSLDMTNVVIIGSSAGAILTAQYGTLLANPDYQEMLGIYPQIDPAAVKALIVEDGAFRPEKFNWGMRVMMANYCGTADIADPIMQKYNAYAYFNRHMAPAFFDAGTIDGFPGDMRACSEKLTALGVENELYLPDTPQNHGFVNQAKDNPVAAECFGKILAFMDRHTK